MAKAVVGKENARLKTLKRTSMKAEKTPKKDKLKNAAAKTPDSILQKKKPKGILKDNVNSGKKGKKRGLPDPITEHSPKKAKAGESPMNGTKLCNRTPSNELPMNAGSPGSKLSKSAKRRLRRERKAAEKAAAVGQNEQQALTFSNVNEGSGKLSRSQRKRLRRKKKREQMRQQREGKQSGLPVNLIDRKFPLPGEKSRGEGKKKSRIAEERKVGQIPAEKGKGDGTPGKPKVCVVTVKGPKNGKGKCAKPKKADKKPPPKKPEKTKGQDGCQKKPQKKAPCQRKEGEDAKKNEEAPEEDEDDEDFEDEEDEDDDSDGSDGIKKEEPRNIQEDDDDDDFDDDEDDDDDFESDTDEEEKEKEGDEENEKENEEQEECEEDSEECEDEEGDDAKAKGADKKGKGSKKPEDEEGDEDDEDCKDEDEEEEKCEDEDEEDEEKCEDEEDDEKDEKCEDEEDEDDCDEEDEKKKEPKPKPKPKKNDKKDGRCNECNDDMEGGFNKKFDSKAGKELTIFMGNLDFKATEEDVRRFVESVLSPEEIEEIELGKNPQGKPRGFGFLKVTSQEAFQKALKLNGAKLNNREVRMLKSEKRADNRKESNGFRSNSRGGFRGGFGGRGGSLGRGRGGFRGNSRGRGGSGGRGGHTFYGKDNSQERNFNKRPWSSDSNRSFDKPKKLKWSEE